MQAPAEVTVLHIARGDRGGHERLSEFVEAYLQCPTGHRHDLVLLSKGWSDARAEAGVDAIAKRCNARVMRVPDAGFDWAAYFRAATSIRSEWLCMLNSHARPIVDNWLRILMGATAFDDVGLIGAIGSWESLAPRADRTPKYVGLPLQFARRIRSSLRGELAPPRFPNPHIRTNGFLIRRELFLRFAASHPAPASKAKAHQLESGADGLSAFVRSQNKVLCVVGADQKLYRWKEWPLSRTFRSGNQNNLLIADNRTIEYEKGSAETKRLLSRYAWGEAGDAAAAY